MWPCGKSIALSPTLKQREDEVELVSHVNYCNASQEPTLLHRCTVLQEPKIQNCTGRFTRTNTTPSFHQNRNYYTVLQEPKLHTKNPGRFTRTNTTAPFRQNQHYYTALPEPTLLCCFTRTKNYKIAPDALWDQHYCIASSEPTLLQRFARTNTTAPLCKNQHYCTVLQEPTLLHRFARTNTTAPLCKNQHYRTASQEPKLQNGTGRFARTNTTASLYKNQHYYTASQEPTLLHRFAKTNTITLLAASQEPKLPQANFRVERLTRKKRRRGKGRAESPPWTCQSCACPGRARADVGSPVPCDLRAPPRTPAKPIGASSCWSAAKTSMTRNTQRNMLFCADLWKTRRKTKRPAEYLRSDL